MSYVTHVLSQITDHWMNHLIENAKPGVDNRVAEHVLRYATAYRVLRRDSLVKTCSVMRL